MTEPALDTFATLRKPTRRSLLLALLVAMLFGAVGAASVMLRAAVFESQALLVIDQPSAIAEAGTPGVVSKLNQLRFKYVVLANTPPITGPVAQRLDLTQEQVTPAISVSAPGPSLIVVVRGRAGSSTIAQGIARETAQELITFLRAEQEASKIAPEIQILFRLVSDADSGKKIQPTVERALATAGISAGVGLLVAYVLIQWIGGRRARRA